MRKLRAVFTALKMTLSGESLTPPHLRPLESWIDEALRRLDQTLRAADARGIKESSRRTIVLEIDGRPTDLELALQMLRHNLVNEYPRLLRLDEPQAIMVVQASNMNDQYRIGRFLTDDVIESANLKRALEALHAHLLALPALESPDTDAGFREC